MSKDSSTAPRSKQQLRRQRSRRAFLAFILIVLALFLSVGAPYATRQLNRLNLLPQAQHFTELAFTNSQSIPKQYTPNARQEVSFAIHNKEGKQMRYAYAIDQTNEEGDNSYALKYGSVTLAAGESKTIKLNVQPTDMGVRSKIIVSLGEPRQSISYWVTRKTQ